ncbi:MAG: hypothetical protein AB8B99_11925 [Phormidesmis sp.]
MAQRYVAQVGWVVCGGFFKMPSIAFFLLEISILEMPILEMSFFSA